MDLDHGIQLCPASWRLWKQRCSKHFKLPRIANSCHWVVRPYSPRTMDVRRAGFRHRISARYHPTDKITSDPLLRSHGHVTSGYLNDFWRFNMSSGIWTWMAGFDQKDRPGIYGTKGLPAASNIPSARGQSAGSMDASGRKIWLFGGYGTSSSALYGTHHSMRI